jgi:hypothetical protein
MNRVAIKRASRLLIVRISPMRALIVKVLIGIAIAAIIVVFALFIVIFGHSAMPV